MRDIFISYAREDQPRAEMLAQILEGRGWSIFWDRTIPVGKTWRETIGRELADARCVIVLWSKNSIESRWVQEEADDAQGRGVLVPILIQNVQAPIGFRSIQAAHLENWDGTESTKAFHRLIADIAALIGLPPKETENERRQVEAEIDRKADEQRKQQELVAQRQAEEEKRKRAEEEGWRKREAEIKRRAKEEGRLSPALPQPRPAWQKFPPTLLVGSLIGLVLIGAIGFWLTPSPTPSPVPSPRPPSPTLVTPTPAAPVTPLLNPLAAMQVTDAPLVPEQERPLKPGDRFKECANCPVMMVVPAGSFTMGSPPNEPGRTSAESPQHTVELSRQFAVGQFAVTFEEWDACVAGGGCNRYRPVDLWGRGRQPVINVSWYDAIAYVGRLLRGTGKQYRLLTEAEYEYATRAGTRSAYPWGSDIGKNNANCNGCGSRWDGTAPVGSFAPNRFGLYDMVGNVSGWTEDCYTADYNVAPTDGSSLQAANCNPRVTRGGSYGASPEYLRSAFRFYQTVTERTNSLGFRIARSLLTP
jgi:formylglycine-generating enzyme required for sulfatase activity